MSERDSVHKEIEKLQEEIKEKNKKMAVHESRNKHHDDDVRIIEKCGKFSRLCRSTVAWPGLIKIETKNCKKNSFKILLKIPIKFLKNSYKYSIKIPLKIRKKSQKIFKNSQK
jgi:hypothetical protein